MGRVLRCCHHCCDYFAPGVATSRDGLRWERGAGDIAGARGAAKDADVGRVLAPNADWWWHDTRHMAVSDVQARLHARLVPYLPAALRLQHRAQPGGCAPKTEALWPMEYCESFATNVK